MSEKKYNPFDTDAFIVSEVAKALRNIAEDPDKHEGNWVAERHALADLLRASADRIDQSTRT